MARPGQRRPCPATHCGLGILHSALHRRAAHLCRCLSIAVWRDGYRPYTKHYDTIAVLGLYNASSYAVLAQTEPLTISFDEQDVARHFTPARGENYAANFTAVLRDSATYMLLPQQQYAMAFQAADKSKLRGTYDTNAVQADAVWDSKAGMPSFPTDAPPTAHVPMRVDMHWMDCPAAMDGSASSSFSSASSSSVSPFVASSTIATISAASSSLQSSIAATPATAATTAAAAGTEGMSSSTAPSSDSSSASTPSTTTASPIAATQLPASSSSSTFSSSASTQSSPSTSSSSLSGYGVWAGVGLGALVLLFLVLGSCWCMARYVTKYQRLDAQVSLDTNCDNEHAIVDTK